MSGIDREVIDILVDSLKNYPMHWSDLKNGMMENEVLGLRVYVGICGPKYRLLQISNVDGTYHVNQGDTFMGTFFGWTVPWRRTIHHFAKNRHKSNVDKFINRLVKNWLHICMGDYSYSEKK